MGGVTKRTYICCIPVGKTKIPDKKADGKSTDKRQADRYKDDDIEYRPPTADTIKRAKKHIIEDDKRGSTVIELIKKDGCGLGLTVVGGADKGDKPRIAHIRPGGLAHRSDVIQVGDVILSVNGIRTMNMKHEEMVNLLKNAEERLSVELEYQLPEIPSPNLSLTCKRAEVILEREGHTFGFTMRGGWNLEGGRCRPLIVTQIRPGGSADREGSLKEGDRILAINGISTNKLDLDEAWMLLKRTDADAVLLVEYDISVLESELENSIGPLMIEVSRAPGTSFGLSLTTSPYKGRQIITVDTVKPASVADRCGALHCGDQLLGINGTSLEHMTVSEASQLLKSAPGTTLQLEIMSLSKLSRHAVTSQVISGSVPSSLQTSSVSIPSLASSSRRGSYAPSNTGSNQAPSFTGSNQAPSYTSSSGAPASFTGSGAPASFGGSQSSRTSSTGAPMSVGSRDSYHQAIRNSHARMGRSSRKSSMATSTHTLSSNQVAHSETTEITLVQAGRGFGFGLRTRGYTADRLVEAPLIDFVEAGGTADRCGLIQEGDRLLSVNGRYLESNTLLEVNQMLRDSGRTCTLEIEFDVAESVVASSGTYNVKIAKRGGTFGITIAAPAGRRSGDPLLIHGVMKGSVAHRTGVIHPGDKLLAIESVRTEPMSVDDAARILGNVEEIVTLKIRKDPTRTEEESSHGVTYTVELHRNGGPLGITLSGTEEPFDPIFVSALTDNGLAMRTGAIHVGDELLAINGRLLHGRPLSDAIGALQSAGDVVTLTVLRRRTQTPVLPAGTLPQTRPESRPDALSPSGGEHQQSGDSALDSWESTGTDHNIRHAGDPRSAGDPRGAGDPRSAGDPSMRPAGTEQTIIRHAINTRPSGNVRLSTFHAQPSRDSACSADSSSDRHSRTSGEVDADQPVPPAGRDLEWSRSVEEYRENRLVLNQLETALINNEETKPMLLGGVHGRRTQQRLSLSSEDNKSSSLSSSGNRYTELDIMKIQEQIHNSSRNIQTELMKVTLYKNADSDNFGLSVSDGMFEKGVFISAIRCGGPADKCGVLRVYDRLLQVNHIKVRDMDCCLVVPLIAASGNQIDLIVARNPLAQPSEDDTTTTSDGSESPPPPPPSPPPSPPLPPPPPPSQMLPQTDNV